jgi:hypothetical protein
VTLTSVAFDPVVAENHGHTPAKTTRGVVTAQPDGVCAANYLLTYPNLLFSRVGFVPRESMMRARPYAEPRAYENEPKKTQPLAGSSHVPCADLTGMWGRATSLRMSHEVVWV